ncbi:energy transducer TonB [Pseudoxanthomonas putridarboris]|uniref:Energy transducer TonB n=1 Tax=Pseudoxanthomonas putridarboris TaxID=752605 RepID=A0ABU9IVP3_9GAMM
MHLAAATALLVDFSGRPPVPVAPPMAAMTVELAPMPSAMEQKQTEMPLGPQQVEKKVQPKPKPQQRLFDPPLEARHKPPKDALAAKPDQEEQIQLDAADRTTDTPTSVAMEQDALKALIEGAPSDQASSAEQTWENALLTHLERYKRYPGAAQARRQEDVVYLRFTMDRSGKVLNWNIERSNGYTLLDGEVNALIQRASPLPVPPKGVGGNTVEMVVPVEFFLRRRVARAGT